MNVARFKSLRAPSMDSPQSPGPAAPKSPLPRLDSARKGASFYDKSAFRVAMSHLLQSSSPAAPETQRAYENLLTRTRSGDPAVEELSGEGVVIEIMKSGRCALANGHASAHPRAFGVIWTLLHLICARPSESLRRKFYRLC